MAKEWDKTSQSNLLQLMENQSLFILWNHFSITHKLIAY
ncbi:hypothetical protein CUZ98_0703 [Enterococcus faecium]|nr:hypothetical protein [Enterococcus faecium]